MQKIVKIFGWEVILNLRNEGDYAIASELFLERQYRFCDTAIREARNAVIDIGAHLGFFSLYASILNSKVPIYAFEPHEGNFALLKENLHLNHAGNVTPKQVAVAGAVGQATLLLSREDLNHSLTHAIEPTGVTQKVQTTTLERIFEKNRLGRADLVKIDCEGGEFEILYSTPPELLGRIGALFIEYHDWVPAYANASAGRPGQSGGELKKFLEGRGFRVEKYPNTRIRELGFLWCESIGR